LFAPAVPKFGKAMQQNYHVAFALFHIMQADVIDSYVPRFQDMVVDIILKKSFL
jgi:hypothetical protein